MLWRRSPCTAGGDAEPWPIMDRTFPTGAPTRPLLETSTRSPGTPADIGLIRMTVPEARRLLARLAMSADWASQTFRCA